MDNVIDVEAISQKGYINKNLPNTFEPTTKVIKSKATERELRKRKSKKFNDSIESKKKIKLSEGINSTTIQSSVASNATEGVKSTTIESSVASNATDGVKSSQIQSSVASNATDGVKSRQIQSSVGSNAIDTQTTTIESSEDIKLTQKVANATEGVKLTPKFANATSKKSPVIGKGNQDVKVRNLKSKKLKLPVITSTKVTKTSKKISVIGSASQDIKSPQSSIGSASQDIKSDPQSSTSLNNSNLNESNVSNCNQSNTTIANYSSEATDTSLLNTIPRKIKEDRKWVKVTDFTTYEDALLEVKKESFWAKCSSSKDMILFRCNKVKLRNEQCQAGLRIVLSQTDLSVTLYKAFKDHNCEQILTKSTKSAMTDELKKFITKLFLNGCKRRKIEDEIIAAEKTMPSKIQLNNFIAELRKEFHGRSTLNTGELDAILKRHMVTPEDDNTAFVINYHIATEPEIHFNFFMSSKKLLQNSARSRIVCADTTYKLLWQGFPVQVVGGIDGAKQFHPSGIAVSCEEDTQDFAFLFNALKNGVQDKLNIDMHPDFILSDAAKAIPNGFRRIYGDDVIELMCWFHMKMATKDKINSMIPTEKRDEIINDIDTLQLAQNPDIFDKAAQLFLEKYKEHTEFIEYFDHQWLQLHRNWYEGAGGFKIPSTDNALERFNGIMKQERTLRQRLSLEHFINQLSTWIKAWSNRYDAGTKEFLNHPLIDLPLMTKSYQWTRLNKVVKKHPSGHFLMVPAGDKMDLSEWNKIYHWNTFDEFKINAFKGYATTVPENDNWIEGTCTCPAFYKDFICKHVVGIAIRIKYLTVPTEAKQVPIGSKRKRGRPSKAKKALLKQ